MECCFSVISDGLCALVHGNRSTTALDACCNRKVGKTRECRQKFSVETRKENWTEKSCRRTNLCMYSKLITKVLWGELSRSSNKSLGVNDRH